MNPNEPFADLHPAKRTQLGLYITAKDACERWKADPDNVRIIDVRTPEEHIFVGHAPMAWKIPVAVQKYVWDPVKGKFPMEPLTDFATRVHQVAKPTDLLMVMCRSGGRSAIAVNMLAQAGFTQVFNIIDGMEGDLVDDPASVFHGRRMRNGWKNAGCPWTYAQSPDRMVFPPAGRSGADRTIEQEANK